DLFAVRSRVGNVERALYQGLILSGGLAALAFLPITYWMMRHVVLKDAALHTPHWWKFYLCSLIGIGVTACLFVITDYFTSTRFRPVRNISRASQTGHATNIIQGLAQGLQSTAPPAIVIALGILGAWKLTGGGTNGIYGIGVAVMAQLSLTGLIVALDAFGPITDNAGGIAEMADLPEEVRRQFREKPGIMQGTERPEYGAAVSLVTRAAQREMILPSLIPIVITLVVGLISVEALGGLLIGVIVVGLFMAVSMTSGGGAWDNAKKLIEDGAYGGKGSESHAASVTGDTVGDP